ncbi:hypothetical protein [Gemmatimonas sp.]|uniref:hypothetical protein n=1 Tax=Gemmatimonas sp. TaxID=1962908 RepID=UPI00356A093F
MLAVAQDTVWITDVANARWLPIDANLNFGSTVAFGSIGGLMLQQSIIGSDMVGNLYFALNQGQEVSLSSKGPLQVPVVRVRRRDWKVDTVTTIVVPSGRASASRTVGPGEIQLMSTRPFAAEDQVAIVPNGSLFVLQTQTKSVKIIELSGRTRIGKPLSRPTIIVNESEKSAFRAAQVVAGSIFVMGGSGSAPRARSAGSRKPGAPLQDMPLTEWPKAKPAFLRGVLSSPTGTVWTLRPAPATEATKTYDLLDGSGQYAGAVSVSRDLSLILIGRQHVYFSYTNEDGVQTVRRYPFPSTSRR